MSRKKTAVDEILALPHTKLIDGKPYVIILYRDATGRRREKTRRVNSVAEAISTIEKIKQEIGQRGPEAFDGERMTFAELLKEYEKSRPIPRWYRDPLEAYFGQKPIRSITYGDIERFKAERAAVPKKYTEVERRSPATINRELETLRTVLLYAVRHEVVGAVAVQQGAGAADQEVRGRTPESPPLARRGSPNPGILYVLQVLDRDEAQSPRDDARGAGRDRRPRPA